MKTRYILQCGLIFIGTLVPTAFACHEVELRPIIGIEVVPVGSSANYYVPDEPPTKPAAFCKQGCSSFTYTWKVNGEVVGSDSTSYEHTWSSIGTKIPLSVTASCGGGGHATAFKDIRVVGVGSVSAGGQISIPGNIKTIYVAKGSDGATIPVTAAPNPSGAWPTGKPTWENANQAYEDEEHEHPIPGLATFPIDSAGTTTVTATCGTSLSINIVVVEVDLLEWKTYGDNTPLDSHPAVPNNGGKRIFPGHQSPTDASSDRKKVYVEAVVSPIVAGIEVYFKWYDVDDPSSDTSPIDSNGAAGNDNRGSGASLSATSATTDANGKASVVFTVSMAPGDNFKVFASTNSSMLNEMTQAKADSMTLPDTVVATEMLTTWRKLWVERDSMETIPTSGNEKNHVSGSATYGPYGVPIPGRTEVELNLNLYDDWSYIDQFENGRFVITDGTTERTYTVFSNTSYYFSHDKIVVIGDPTGDFGGNPPTDYELYDDDATAMPTYPDIENSSWGSKFNVAYIKPVNIDASDNPRKTVVFDRNLDIYAVMTVSGNWMMQRDHSSSNSFWNVLVVSAFQDTDKDTDGDIYEVCGVSAIAGNACVFYAETCREASGSDVEHTIVHELGHTGGVLYHCGPATLIPPQIERGCGQTNCLMSNGGPGSDFCDYNIVEFRKDSNW